MRFFIRPADFKDKEDLLALSRLFPLGSLPRQSSQLEEKILISQKSFKQKGPKEKRLYLFVLEDTKQKKIIGSSQILPRFDPASSLRYSLKQQGGKVYLKLKSNQRGRNQIGGLILHPDFRKSKERLGLQIGLVRFLYIKTFSQEFSPLIEVSLTAPIKNNSNPFWRETGEKYLKISYQEALDYFRKDRAGFFSLFPKNLKIPLSQLSPSAKSCMKQIHPQTAPVYKGLLKRGFKPTKHYHVLDGGIYLSAYWEKLPFLKQTKEFFLKKSKEIKVSRFFLSQQTEKGFFCAPSPAQIKGSNLLIPYIPKEFEKNKPVLALKLPF